MSIPARSSPLYRIGCLAPHDVTFQFGASIVKVDEGTLFTGDRSCSADRIWICCGDELGILFPDLLESAGLVRCKLQMMRSQPFGHELRIGPMLAAGLTLRHYVGFRDCPTLVELKNRIARDLPWLDRYGIHVLVSQNGRGELTLGDSHEYGEQIEPFDKAEIEPGSSITSGLSWMLRSCGSLRDGTAPT